MGPTAARGPGDMGRWRLAFDLPRPTNEGRRRRLPLPFTSILVGNASRIHRSSQQSNNPGKYARPIV
jgi:hypothetical protein